MPDNVSSVVSAEQVKLPDIPLTDAELLKWIEEQKRKEAEAQGS